MTYASGLFALILLFVGVPLICWVTVKFIAGTVDRSDARAHKLDQEEAAIIQELHDGMEKMEKRIEALETILMNKRS